MIFSCEARKAAAALYSSILSKLLLGSSCRLSSAGTPSNASDPSTRAQRKRCRLTTPDERQIQ
jgi:hypothetical protein